MATKSLKGLAFGCEQSVSVHRVLIPGKEDMMTVCIIRREVVTARTSAPAKRLAG
jgi:hypothetical protein